MASAAKTASQGKRGGKVAPKTGPASWLQKVQSWPGDFSSYVDGLKREMKLVTWPNREQVRATTIVVLATVFVFAIFFGVVDYVLTLAQTNLYERFTQ